MTFDEQNKTRTGMDLPVLYLPPTASLPEPKPIEASRVCVIYARYSTLGQRESSIERQVADCHLYIAEHELQHVDTYADRGVSGTTDQREELYRLREDAKKGRFTHVIVESLDRLARKLRVAIAIFEELIDLGIVLHDAEENRPLSILDIGHKGAASQAARDLLVKRNKAGKRRNASLGTFGIANCFGYERDWDAEKKALVWRANRNEAALVVEAYELFASGISAPRIVELFNARPAEERGNRVWKRNSLVGSSRFGTGLLRRLRYVGLRIHGRAKLIKETDDAGKNRWKVELHPLSHWVVGTLDASLQIVEKDLFDRVQAILKDRAEAAAALRGPVPRYTAKHAPLRGLISCVHCGAGMTPTQKRKDGKARLLCNRARNNDGCDNTHSFALEAVEDEVHRLLAENLSSPEAWTSYFEAYNASRSDRPAILDQKKRKLEGSRSNLIRRLDRIREDEEHRRYPPEYLENARLKANADYNDLERRLAELTALSRTAKEGASSSEIFDTHRMLLGSLADVFRNDFDGASETGTRVVAALRRLIHSVVLDIDGSGCSIQLKCRILSPRDDSEDNIATFTSRLERQSGAWHASIREVRRVNKMAEEGSRSITDDEWQQIAHLIPDSVSRSKRGGVALDKRNIINAALLHLWEGVPLQHMPSIFGPTDAIFAGLKRLSESGSWDAVAEALHNISPARIPDVKSNMFTTQRGRTSSSLKGLPLIRAQHGATAAAGLHAPSDFVWEKVQKLIPEQVLQVNKQPALIEPRTFVHGFLFWLNEGIPMTHLPLLFGSTNFFNHALNRLAGHGKLDELVSTLLGMSPSPLQTENLSRLDRFPRVTAARAVWRRALPKRSDTEGIPEYFPDEKTWHLVQHLFPPNLLFVNNKNVIQSPQRLAHAILYRVREKIPFSAMPRYFGDPTEVELVATKWVFHHLWDEFRRVLEEHAPEVLQEADLEVFKYYRRGRTLRYRNLIDTERDPIPMHRPSDEDFALVKDLIPEEVLCIRGGPAIMDPRKFFHAIVFMLKERTSFGGLPRYFGSNWDVRVATRRFVSHHYWDTMRARIEHFEPEWANNADFTLFDGMRRSANPEPDFRRRLPRAPIR